MKYDLLLDINDLSVYELLEPDLRKADRLRSTIQLSKKDAKVQIKINADDAVALRSSFDSIIQLLKIHEKIGGAK
jgi:tRNA threonylcarbamoyladenosine modification (KEOPS) complex  Pcc1 subunit